MSWQSSFDALFGPLRGPDQHLKRKYAAWLAIRELLDDMLTVDKPPAANVQKTAAIVDAAVNTAERLAHGMPSPRRMRLVAAAKLLRRELKEAGLVVDTKRKLVTLRA